MAQSKESSCHVGDVGLIPGLRRYSGKKKKMASRLSVLAGRIPWTEEPGRLQGTGSQSQIRLATAAAAKSLQSCPTLCDPRDGSPSGSPVPGMLQERILKWLAISFSNA